MLDVSDFTCILKSFLDTFFSLFEKNFVFCSNYESVYKVCLEEISELNAQQENQV